MIQPSDAEAHFRRMLRDAGFSEQAPDVLVAWRVFREFASVPVAGAEDDLLFQCGVYDFDGRELFHLGFVRQLSFEEDGEYDHMEQFQCNLFYEPDPELQEMETNLWSSDFDSADEFFASVEALPEFNAGLRGRAPIGVELHHENV